MKKNRACSAQIHSRERGHLPSYGCTKTPSHFEGGRWWCTQHAPSLKKMRSDERYKKYTERMDARTNQLARMATCARAMMGVRNPIAFMRDATEAIRMAERRLLGSDFREAADRAAKRLPRARR